MTGFLFGNATLYGKYCGGFKASCARAEALRVVICVERCSSVDCRAQGIDCRGWSVKGLIHHVHTTVLIDMTNSSELFSIMYQCSMDSTQVILQRSSSMKFQSPGNRR